MGVLPGAPCRPAGSAVSRLLDSRAACSCYVIAEAGSNHNRDWSLAKQLVAVAADAGADAVKFQAFQADRLYPARAGAADYLEDTEDIHEIVARMELPKDWLPKLAELTDRAGIDLLVSVFDEEIADVVDPFVPAHKVASYELTHEPLIRKIATFGKPLFVSTGASEIDEIERAIEAAREAGAYDITLLQCTAAYPANLESLNVAAINDLRTRFDVPVGLSDHSDDPVVGPVLAVAFGATVIEKHFTVDRSLPGPDHRFALEPEGLRQMIKAIRGAEAARGSGRKVLHADEEELRGFARRAVFAIRDIEAGETLDEQSLAVLRTGKLGGGLTPAELASALGKQAARRIAAHSPVRAGDIVWPA
jgi:sialic acid synthase SpsE